MRVSLLALATMSLVLVCLPKQSAAAASGEVAASSGTVDQMRSTVKTSASNVPADGTTATITVTLLDSTGAPVAGKTVGLVDTMGLYRGEPGQTDASGVAIFTVASRYVGTDTLRVRDRTDAIDLRAITIAFTTPPASVTNSTVTANAAQLNASGGVHAEAEITVTLKDRAGDPIVGARPSLKASNAGGPLSGGWFFPPTNTNGVASVQLQHSKAETLTFTAESNGVDIAGPTIQFVAGPVSPSHSNITESTTSLVADGTTPVTLKVHAMDENDNPKIGASVSLAGGSSTTISPNPATTDSQGVASFTVTTTKPQLTSFSANVDSITIGPSNSIIFRPGPVDPSRSTFSVSPTTVRANPQKSSAASALQASVTLVDANGNKIGSKAVSISGSPYLIGTTTGTTDGYGAVQLHVGDTTAENVTLKAIDTTDSITLSTTVAVQFTAGPADSNLSTIQAQSTAAPANGTSAIMIVVTLHDSRGLPLSGKTASLAPISPHNSAQVTPGSATTDSHGSATFNVTDTRAEAIGYRGLDSTDGVRTFTSASVTFTSVRTALATPSPAPTPGVVVASRPASCVAHQPDEIVDEQVGQFFCFAGLNLRVDSVQTFDRADNSLLLTKNLNTSANPDLGYIVVKVTMQNRSQSHTQNYPGNLLGFDLADGSKMDVDLYSGEYVGANLDEAPGELSPGQTLQTTYVVVNWNRSPVRTLYLKRNAGDAENDPGVQYARFRIGSP